MHFKRLNCIFGDKSMYLYYSLAIPLNFKTKCVCISNLDKLKLIDGIILDLREKIHLSSEMFKIDIQIFIFILLQCMPNSKSRPGRHLEIETICFVDKRSFFVWKKKK